MKTKQIYLCFAACTMLFFSAIPAAYADEICDAAIAEGKQKYNAGNYQKAKELFEYAQSECGSNYSGAQSWINKCNEALAPTTLSVSSSSLSFGADGGQKTIAVTCNRGWMLANTSSNMFTISRNGNQASVRCYANSNTNSRTDWFEIKSSDGTQSRRITISQQGRPYSSQTNNNTATNRNTTATTKTFTANGVEFTMVYVQGGTFTMGATSEQGSDAYDWEKPTHRVTLSNYYIGQTEVTQALWQAVMGNNPSHFRGANKPVESVSYNDCKAFISKLNSLTGQNFRLPTEAEWEFAARGGNRSRGYKYAGSDNLSTVAWYDGNSGYATHPVAQKSPNELGLYDMSGNVWEWCNDWYGDYSSNAQTNPQGPYSGSYRVLRGGSYILARYCRVSYRIYITPSCSSSGLGLRLAL